MTKIDEMMDQCLRVTADNVLLLEVLVQPKASRNALCGMHGERLKIALTSPPVEGKANKALCQFLSKVLGVAKSNVALQAGLSSRRKTVTIEGVSRDDAMRKLQGKLAG